MLLEKNLNCSLLGTTPISSSKYGKCVTRVNRANLQRTGHPPKVTVQAGKVLLREILNRLLEHPRSSSNPQRIDSVHGTVIRPALDRFGLHGKKKEI